MHELAIAQSLVAIAAEHAGERRVAKVEVTVGHLRQVVASALTFGFQVAAEGTVAEGAELAITEVPARGVCRGCEAESELHGFPFACGACGGFDLEMVAGEELAVEALELTDEPLTEEVGSGSQR